MAVITESLKKNRQFRFVYHHGVSAANRLLVLYIVRGPVVSAHTGNGGDSGKAGHTGNGDKTGNMLGVSVSKKVGKAVIRNRIKRMIKESYRLMEPRVAGGCQMVVVARKSAGQLSRATAFHAIQSALSHLMKKQQILAD